MKKQEPRTSRDASGTEEDLARWAARAQAGDREDYVRLLTAIETRLPNHIAAACRRLGVSDESRQDVLQEILLAVHRKLATYDPAQPFLPWLYAIAHYKIIDGFRTARTARLRTEALDEELHQVAVTTADDDRLSWETLSQQLSEKQREVINLVKIEGLSTEEAARRTGYSPSDIKVTVHRALNALKRWVSEDDP